MADPKWIGLQERIAALKAENKRLRAVLEDIKLIHPMDVEYDEEPNFFCESCNEGGWPCPTVERIDAALAGEGE